MNSSDSTSGTPDAGACSSTSDSENVDSTSTFACNVCKTFTKETLTKLDIICSNKETSMSELFAKISKTPGDNTENPTIDQLFAQFSLTSNTSKQVLQLKMLKLLMSVIEETLSLSLDNFNQDLFVGYDKPNDFLYKEKCQKVKEEINANLTTINQDLDDWVCKKEGRVHCVLENAKQLGLQLDSEELHLFKRLVFNCKGLRKDSKLAKYPD